MAKKLSEIQELVDSSTEEFLLYIQRNVDAEVYSFLLELIELTEVYVFSGIIRNFFLQKEEIRDLDIIIRDDINIEKLIAKTISIRQNSFGGYKINISEINIDLWTIEKTWAVQYQKRLEFGVDDLQKFIPSTAFFNFSAILFSLNEEKFYYKNDFLSFVQNREISYVYLPNANYSLCVVNSLYYEQTYNLKISDKLKRYLIELHKKKLNYSDIQIKHFGEILYSEEDIRHRISNFKFTKSYKSDYLTEDLNEVFLRLGLNENNGLYITANDSWKTQTAFPNRIKRLIEREIKPDAFFCFDNKPLILFFENPSNKFDLHRAIWNFNECPIVIIIENNIVEVFNGFDFDLKAKLLKNLGKEEKLNDFKYFELVTGKTWEQYKEILDYKNRVDHHLLQNIKSARNLLVEKHKLNSKIANAIIGKSIFVRYLIDRRVKMKFDGALRVWTNTEFCQLLSDPNEIKRFFNYLEDNERGFNGDLFPLTTEEYDSITSEDYLVIQRLLLGQRLDNNQISLFEFYDFSIIPIEFISNVYEMFIGQDNQKKEGAYYTPLFLVDYILKETVDKHLSRSNKLDSRLNETLSIKPKNYSLCKVLDPACGSGIFLVETLRKIIEKYILDTGIEIKSERFKTVIKNLAKENLFGIDKDLSAVQVAIFSIYLTLLDYLEPPSIETFKFPVLFNTNFFEADFFDESISFNAQLKKIKFDFIIGNPPWMRGKGEKEKPLYVRYIESRRIRERGTSIQIDIGNKEIAQAFILRTSDFSTKGKTKSALIVTSKVLYNLQSKLFRKYFLQCFFIDQIFELAAVRKEVFDKSNDKAVAPAAVLFFRFANNQNTDSNIIEHISLKPSRFFSLFKIFTINRTDFKAIEQIKLKEFDWLWKVLVYGSYLDFNFIKRLKSSFQTIKERLSNEEDLIIGQGVMVGGGDDNDATELIGKPFIDTRLDIQQYWINNENDKIWTDNTVHRVRNPELYKAPVLLITGGNNIELKCVSALNLIDSVFKSSLTGIRNNNVKLLRQISAILNSSFFAYINMLTFSSTGIEREESHDDEKLIIPFATNKNLHVLVDEVEKLMLTKNDKNIILVDYNLDNSIKDKLSEIDQNLYQSYSCTNEEIALFDYTNKVVIPIAMKHKGYENHFKPLQADSEKLESYASLFVNRFESKLVIENKKFIVEVWHTNQIIGMFFKMIPHSDFVNRIQVFNKQNDAEIISFLTSISSTKITDKLFIQKDVRGFESDYFYIFKPNESRLWEEAIAHLDVNEFADAILKEGRKTL